MYKIIRASDGSMRQVAPGKTATNLITKEVSPEVSLAATESTDPAYSEQETAPYNRIYYVLEGELELIFDSKPAALKPGDACFIAKDTTYEMRGKFKAVTVNQPAFGSEAA